MAEFKSTVRTGRFHWSLLAITNRRTNKRLVADLESGRLSPLTDILLGVGPVRAKIRLEIAVGHQLHDDQRRLSFGDHTQQFDHVMGFEFPEKQDNNNQT